MNPHKVWRQKVINLVADILEKHDDPPAIFVFAKLREHGFKPEGGRWTIQKLQDIVDDV